MLADDAKAAIKQAKGILVGHLLAQPHGGDPVRRTNILLEGMLRALIVLLPDEK